MEKKVFRIGGGRREEPTSADEEKTNGKTRLARVFFRLLVHFEPVTTSEITRGGSYEPWIFEFCIPIIRVWRQIKSRHQTARSPTHSTTLVTQPELFATCPPTSHHHHHHQYVVLKNVTANLHGLCWVSRIQNSFRKDDAQQQASWGGAGHSPAKKQQCMIRQRCWLMAPCMDEEWWQWE